MGTFRFTGTGVDLATFTLDGILELPIVTSTSTRLALGTAASDFSLAAVGTGFVYVRQSGQIVDVTAGTLSTFSGRGGGEFSGDSFTWSNLNLSMATLANHLFSNNWVAFREYMFSRNDSIIGTGFGDSLASYAGNDTVLGGNGADSIVSGVGNDRLMGEGGNDTLRGGSGADTLLGGLGADELRGGGGQDAFVFSTVLGSTQRDTITDFSAVDDVIRLENAIFTAFANTGTMVASRFHVGVAAAEAGDRIIYDRAEGVLSYDRDGTGSAAAVVFALVDPGTVLTYRDIVII